ncbi:MAG: YibE/F family protein [Elusimicrobia bacterium]|nr:YibE/F family protein [Elusimicrobiota bacterium]
MKKKLFLIFILLITYYLSLITAVNADSWSERPDYDFYAHPLLEISKSNDKFTIGKVTDIVEKQGQKETLNVQLLNGKIVKAETYKSDFPIITKKGTMVLLTQNTSEKTVVVDYDRSFYLLILAALFIFIVLIVGGIKKLTGLVALGAGIIFVIFVFLPLFLRGWSPLFLTVISVILITVSIITGINGLNKKTASAIAGTILSSIFVMILGLIFYPLAHINGFSLEPVQMLNYFSKNYTSFPFEKFSELLISILLIGATGIIIDVAICVSSIMEEMVSKNSRIARRQLLMLGLKAGREIAATVSNTLILAYFGCELIVILATTISIKSLVQLFNNEWFFIVVFQMLAGSIGFFVAVPLTALAASFLMVKKSN